MYFGVCRVVALTSDPALGRPSGFRPGSVRVPDRDDLRPSDVRP
jgi:hypothetical protein